MREILPQSNLQLLFEKFHRSADDARFYQERLEVANERLGLNHPRSDFPGGEVLEEDDQLGRSNIYAIRFGEKSVKGEWVDRPAIILFVAKKAPLEKVAFQYHAPQIGTRFFDNKFPTDVIELKVTHKTPNYPR